MKIVQSFWTGNVSDTSKTYGWLTSKYHYLGWILSVNQLKKFYSEVELVTDTYGYDILIEKLNLPYSKVHVVLDELNKYNPNLWALAKIKAYQMMDVPFLHIDGDVFIWKPFDSKLLASGLIAQNLERTTNYYRNMWEPISKKLPYISSLMKNYHKGIHNKAYNMGIFGGTDLAFIHQYTNKSFEFVNKNSTVHDKINAFNFNVFFEQVLFYELVKSKNKEVSCLWQKEIKDNDYQGISNFHEVPFKRTYLHLLGDFKRMHNVCLSLEGDVLSQYPKYYKKLENLMNCSKPLSTFGYRYTTTHNTVLKREYLNKLVNLNLKAKKKDLKQIVSRNLFLKGEVEYLTHLIHSNKRFVITPTSNFTLFDRKANKYMLVYQIESKPLKIKLYSIDEVIFKECDGRTTNKEFEKNALAYLSDDFPTEEKKPFIDLLWKRIFFFVSINVLVAIKESLINNIDIKIVLKEKVDA